MKLYVRTNVEGIMDFYNAIAEQLGYDKDKVHYDCTKIEVSEARQEAVEEYYKANDSTDWELAFGMHWVCYGPKVNHDLQGDEIEIGEKFITEDDEIEETVA